MGSGRTEISKGKYVSIGDQITIKDVDELLIDRIQSGFLVIGINHIRALATLKNGTKYKVVDSCPPCRKVYIKVKGKNTGISVKHIKEVFEK